MGQFAYATEAEYVAAMAAGPYVVPASLIDGAPPAASPLSRWQWNLRAVLDGQPYPALFADAPRDVIVCVIDKWPGHGGHDDLVPVYEPGINLVDGGTETSAPWDGNPPNGTNVHGQCAASMIAARHGNSGMAGLFHRARILPIRASIATLAAAIGAAVDRGAEVIHVAGYEWAGDQLRTLFPEHYLPPGGRPAWSSDAERAIMHPLLAGIRYAIEEAHGAGVVLSTGISNRNGALATSFIASRPQMIVTGAVNILGQAAYFNSLSHRYDIMAPGGDYRPLPTSVPTLPFDQLLWMGAQANADDVMCCLGPTKHSWMAGGSAAAPHTAAAAAIVKSYRPTADGDDVRALLVASARPVAPSHVMAGAGAGILNLAGLRALL